MMAKELSKDELLKWLDTAGRKVAIFTTGYTLSEHQQAYQQIRKLIEIYYSESPPGIVGDILDGSISKDSVYFLKERPKVSEEFLGRWANNIIHELFTNQHFEIGAYKERLIKIAIILIKGMFQEAGVEIEE